MLKGFKKVIKKQRLLHSNLVHIKHYYKIQNDYLNTYSQVIFRFSAI